MEPRTVLSSKREREFPKAWAPGDGIFRDPNNHYTTLTGKQLVTNLKVAFLPKAMSVILFNPEPGEV